MQLLASYTEGCWHTPTEAQEELRDPIHGTVLAGLNASGLDLHAAYHYARTVGGPALRSLSYAKRAELLQAAVEILKPNRPRYFEIAQKNSGTTEADSAVDIDGGIYTLAWYAHQGKTLTGNTLLLDGSSDSLAKDDSFATQHIRVSSQGLALLINAFNFPSWGLWEKAAAALLSGMPIVVKPASATAWLSYAMLKDVLEADIFPAGAISLVTGRPDGLLDHLEALDLVSFTGSADTAEQLRQHPLIRSGAVRLNAETDSINSAILCPDASVDSIQALAKEVRNELRSKSGQKCTAIRRIFVPTKRLEEVATACCAALAKIVVGDPSHSHVTMGSLASYSQYQTVQQQLASLDSYLEPVFDGRLQLSIQAPAGHACLAPVLYSAAACPHDPRVHDTEVFGPVATLVPYDSVDELSALVRLGGGSLVASLYADTKEQALPLINRLAEQHGRLHIVCPGSKHTGHGNVMPQSLHGGPGRAGGGAELGGLRALHFYHNLCAIQAPADMLAALSQKS
ncbi:3,4-dehydroadipyl-CoA semialdehyde dehydrogenase [Alcaligenes endophyticus]|uniref:3,4-dehydroadipyl-CoA semialdehyde dehydrogenase n=1 Tax=Alcaligenes endophyticus TaxID=1929088 RepID=A0ABT8EH00_9BURK|nr:3,4-dehydroadipyl-CoA semialdehyde dehydrogenase [Alcaligenes endophyticus]MCX5589776.1 3,4-dehydroadipyl-CoA semialdehyde dehydrogenase [Alcaligenes endophyticus]MDN4120561.1 3,4-dehydroadipyl-CoA semialdehyde dehydrogenase [Alcaligenes endophyticus]